MPEDTIYDGLMRAANPAVVRRLDAEVDAALARVLRMLPATGEDHASRAASSRARAWLPARAVAVLTVGVSALVALLIACVLLLSSGASTAFAGWTATPSRASASSTADALKTCGDVPARDLLATDARGPYLAIVYTRRDSPWQCVTEGHEVLQNRTTVFPPSAVVRPSAGKVSLPMVSRTVSGTSKARVRSLLAHESALVTRYQPVMKRTGSYPAAFNRKDNSLERQVYALTTGPKSLTAVSGSVGADVKAVTFVLSDGTRVRATVGNGWYLAWWPGSSELHAPDPASIRVTTAAGASRVLYGTSYLRRFYGPCVSASTCWGAGLPPVRAGFATSLEQRFAIFRTTRPTPPSRVAAVDLRGYFGGYNAIHRSLGLDESQMREVSHGSNGIVLVIPGREGVCVTRTFPPSVDLGGNPGSCDYLSTVLRQGLISISDGSTLEGLVPDGNATVTVHFGSGRTVAVPVKDNTVLAVFDRAPKFVTLGNTRRHHSAHG